MVTRERREPTRWERFKDWVRWEWQWIWPPISVVLFVVVFALAVFLWGKVVMPALFGEPEACTLPAEPSMNPWGPIPGDCH